MTKLFPGKSVTRETAILHRGDPLVVDLYPRHLEIRVKGHRSTVVSVDYDAVFDLAKEDAVSERAAGEGPGEERSAAVSGGAWNYRQHRLREDALKAAAAFNLLAYIEQELDWGVCNDSCYECSKIRVIAGLEKYFEQGAEFSEDAIKVLVDHDAPEHQCSAHQKRNQPAGDSRAESPKVEPKLEG